MRPRFVAALIAAGAAAPGTARADLDWFLVPALSARQTYDDNVFSSPTQAEEDRVFQAGPAVEAGVHAPRLTLLGRYEFVEEDYAEHSELDADRAREDAALGYRYDVTRRSTLTLDALYARTNRPGELDPALGVDDRRGDAESRSLIGAVRHRLDSRTVGTAEYGFLRETLAGRPGADTRTAELGWERDASRLTTVLVGYIRREFRFAGQDEITADTLLGGMTHAFTPRTAGTIRIGPRYSQGVVDLEGSLEVVYRLEPGSLLLTYGRSVTSVIGLDSPVTTEVVDVALVRPIGRDLELRATASGSSSTRDAFSATMRRVGLEGSYRVDQALSIVASAQSSEQEGSLDAQGGATVRRNLIMLGLVLRGGLGPRIKPEPVGPQPPPSRKEPEDQP